MPKEIFEIKDFSGGLVNGPDPRDINDNMLVKLTNCVSSNFGKIEPMGEERPHAISLDSGTITSNLTPGYGLHTIRADFPIIFGNHKSIQFGDPTLNDSAQPLPVTWGLSQGQESAVDNTATWAYIKVSSTSPISVEHHLSTGSKILLAGHLNDSSWDCQQWTEVIRINDFEFQYQNPLETSVTSGTTVSWISGDYGVYYNELSDNSQFPETNSSSYTFLCLQNNNKFHVYQNETKNFFYNVGKISENTTSTNIKPNFIYLDNGLRMNDFEFTNKTSRYQVNANNSIPTAHTPRVFIYKEEQKIFNTIDSPNGKIVNSGWRDELNSVYEANDILTHYPACTIDSTNSQTVGDGGGFFNVIKRDDGSAAAIDDNEFSSGDTNFMKVSLGISFNTTIGEWETNGLHKEIKFGISYIFDEESEQESRVFKNTTAIAMDVPQELASINFQIGVKENEFPVRCVGIAIYIWYVNGELDDPLSLGRALFDKTKGWEGHDSRRQDWAPHATNVTTSLIDLQGSNDLVMKTFPVISYRLNNGYKHDLDSATFRYKTSAVCNRRLYIGNIMQVGGRSHNRIHHDRVIKSPVNRFDILPKDNYIDVSTNDGDEIVKLVSFQDKLLQFKNHTLYIINVSESEYIEKEEKFKGINHPDAVTKFSNGVIWGNKLGAYLYDGNQIVNLIEGKIHSNFWKACVGDSKISVGFLPEYNQIVYYVKYNPYTSYKIDSLTEGLNDSLGGETNTQDNIMLFDLSTGIWSFGANKLSSSVKTNLIDNFDDQLIFGIGTGLIQENHTVVKTQNLDTPVGGQGHFQFIRNEGKLNSSNYKYLWFYYADDGSGNPGWVKIGDISYSRWGEEFSENSNLALIVVNELATKINAFEQNYERDKLGYYTAIAVIDSGLDDGLEDDPTNIE